VPLHSSEILEHEPVKMVDIVMSNTSVDVHLRCLCGTVYKAFSADKEEQIQEDILF
jgi:hypothetical protein